MEGQECIKYVIILESLKFKDKNDIGIAPRGKETNNLVEVKESDELTRLEYNIDIIEKFLKLEPKLIVEEIIRELDIQHSRQDNCSQSESKAPCNCFSQDLAALKKGCLNLLNVLDSKNENKSLDYTYVMYLQCLLLKIINEMQSLNKANKDEMISIRQKNNCIQAIKDLAYYALRCQLHSAFYETALFAAARRSPSMSPNYELLFVSIQSFQAALSIQHFHVANAMETVLRDYVAAVFTLHVAHVTKEWSMDQLMLARLSENLSILWTNRTRIQYFRTIMMLKSIPRLPVQLQRMLHMELVGKLHAQDGFRTLVATLTNTRSDQQEKTTSNVKGPLNDKQVFELIANIVAFRGYSKNLHNTLIAEIFKFLEECLQHEAMLDYMGAGLLSLRRLYDKDDVNKAKIKEKLNDMLVELVNPKDLLTGLIVKEHNEFTLIIEMLYQLFCTSIVECLPSELLVPYLPLLLQIYHHIPENFQHKNQIADLVTRCLHNRTTAELQYIIERLYTHQFDNDWCELHARVVIFPNTEQTNLTVKISSSDAKHDNSTSLSLPELLMNTEHHILTYRIFTVLLQLMSKILDDISFKQYDEQITLLQSEEELITFLNSKYPVKVEILLSLNALISYQPLKTQISENSKEFLHFLRTMLEQRLKKDSSNIDETVEAMDHTLLILLTLMQELLEQSQIPETFREFMPTLHKLQERTPNLLIKQRISSLSTVLSGDLKANAAQQSTEFNTARSFVESKESHIQVYGIQMLLDLLRRRDNVTLSNAHLLMALALNTLKNKESYTFLNCVRLFVALVHVMEAEVLETLADEYLSEHADIDYRLVVGEAILKVGQELGPLSYKYKDALLNCYMTGARNTVDEFRMSSYVNLAQMTRTLCYQVCSYFQEMLQLINNELSTGKYLPAKRAAVLVLSDLLEGMDNLVDFEEMLLPIYRLLKVLEADENGDTKIREHAANGLKALTEKCKKFLFPAQQKEKEIRIFGINDSKNTRKTILELN